MVALVISILNPAKEFYGYGLGLTAYYRSSRPCLLRVHQDWYPVLRSWPESILLNLGNPKTVVLRQKLNQENQWMFVCRLTLRHTVKKSLCVYWTNQRVLLVLIKWGLNLALSLSGRKHTVAETVLFWLQVQLEAVNPPPCMLR